MNTMTAPARAPRPMPRPMPRPEPVRRPTPRRDHLRVVTEQDRRRRRLSPAAGVVLTAALFVTLFLVAGAQSLLVQGQVRLDGLDEQLATEQAHYQELRKDVAQMESPERIVAAAQAQGMVTPSDLVYLQPEAATRTADQVVEQAATDAELARPTDGEWSTVKPLLGTPAP